MEPSERGWVEALLDRALSDRYLDGRIAYWEHLKSEGVVDSVQSAVLGEIWGNLHTFTLSTMENLSDIERQQKVKTQVVEIYTRRVLEIKSKLTMKLNK